MSAVVGLFVLSALWGGCNGSSDSEEEQAPELPFAGQKVEILVPRGHGFPALWESILSEWSAQTDADYRITEYPTSKLDSSPSQLLSSGDDSQILFFPLTLLPQLAAQDLLEAIPQDEGVDRQLNWLDLFSGLRKQVASVEGNPTVVPLSCPALVCYYRRDLLEAASLSPPQTWDDYQDLLEKLEDWAPGMVAVEPWSADFRATMFLVRALSYTKHPGHYSLFFDIDSGQPLIDSAGFVRGLEKSLEALSLMPAEVTEYSPADCRRALLTGRAALAISFETGLENRPLAFTPGSSGRESDQSAVQETPVGTEQMDTVQIGFCRLPGSREVYNRSTKEWEPPPNAPLNRPTLTAFGGFAVGLTKGKEGSAQSQAAWNLLATLNAPDILQTFPAETKTPCRNSQLEEPGSWIGPELQGREAREYLQTLAESLREPQLVAELFVAGRSEFRTALTEGLDKALSGEQEAAETLTQVRRDWEKIIESLGVDAVRDSYRRSLGLPPRPSARGR